MDSVHIVKMQDTKTLGAFPCPPVSSEPFTGKSNQKNPYRQKKETDGIANIFGLGSRSEIPSKIDSFNDRVNIRKNDQRNTDVEARLVRHR